jgi:hypothetical protein
MPYGIRARNNAKGSYMRKAIQFDELSERVKREAGHKEEKVL